MSTPRQNIFALFAGIWPRVAGFSHTPSLLVIAVLVNIIALVPAQLRLQKDQPSCASRTPACAQDTPASISSD